MSIQPELVELDRDEGKLPSITNIKTKGLVLKADVRLSVLTQELIPPGDKYEVILIFALNGDNPFKVTLDDVFDPSEHVQKGAYAIRLETALDTMDRCEALAQVLTNSRVMISRYYEDKDLDIAYVEVELTSHPYVSSVRVEARKLVNFLTLQLRK